MKIYVLALGIWLSFQSPALSKSTVVDVAMLDVAGVRLGMTPDEARLALKVRGFVLSDDHRYLSWNAQVAAEAGKYINTPKDTSEAVWETSASGPDFQSVWVRYEISALGSFVKKVEYKRPARIGSLLALAKERYGAPTRIGMNTYHYCPMLKGCPDTLFSQASFPSVEVYSPSIEGGGASMITLTQGIEADRRWDAKFQAAVLAIAPSYGKAAF